MSSSVKWRAGNKRFLFRFKLEVTWNLNSPSLLLPLQDHASIFLRKSKVKEGSLLYALGREEELLFSFSFVLLPGMETKSVHTLKHALTQKGWEIVLWSVCSCIWASDTPFIILWIIALYLLKPVIKLTLEGRPRKRERGREVEVVRRPWAYLCVGVCVCAHAVETEAVQFSLPLCLLMNLRSLHSSFCHASLCTL